MKTRYIGIESIIIVDKEYATIACNIMLEGKFYDEPIYTNVFCYYTELIEFLKLDNSDLSKEVVTDIETQYIISEEDKIEIHLPPYINNKIEWKFPIMVDLKISKNPGIPFECYSFTDITKAEF